MGVASLLVPLATVRSCAAWCRQDQAGNVIVGVAVGAAAVTTIADRLAGHEDEPLDPRDRVVEDHDVPHGRGREVRRWPEGAAGHRSGRHRRRRGGGIRVGLEPHPGQAHVGEGPAARPRWGVVPAALAIVGWDFIYYWNHRLMHEVRALWAHHVVHHSSERYNLSTALRQPVADVLGVYLPYGLMARVGIRPALIEQARREPPVPVLDPHRCHPLARRARRC